MPGYVYILASKRNGTLYVGSTVDIVRRMEQHRADAVDSFVRRYGVHRLVHLEDHADIGRRASASGGSRIGADRGNWP